MKKKNILLKSAIGIGSIAAISTAAVAATSCSHSTPTPEPTYNYIYTIDTPYYKDVENKVHYQATQYKDGVINDVKYGTCELTTLTGNISSYDVTFDNGETNTYAVDWIFTPLPDPTPVSSITHETFSLNNIYYDGNDLRYQYEELVNDVEDWLLYIPNENGAATYQDDKTGGEAITVLDTCVYLQYLFEDQYDDQLVIYGDSEQMLKDNFNTIFYSLYIYYDVAWYWLPNDWNDPDSNNGEWVGFTQPSDALTVFNNYCLKGYDVWFADIREQREYRVTFKILDNYKDVVTTAGNIKEAGSSSVYSEIA